MKRTGDRSDGALWREGEERGGESYDGRADERARGRGVPQPAYDSNPNPIFF